MYDGFIKVAAATPGIRVADTEYNTEQIAMQMKDAYEQGAALVVFPELALTAYTCGDLFLQDTLLKGAEKGLEELLEYSNAFDMIAVIGLPVVHKGSTYNCAAVIHKGVLLGVVPKSSIPGYGEYAESRYFNPAPRYNDTICLAGQEAPFGNRLLFCCEEVRAWKWAVEIAEDLLAVQPVSVQHAIAGAVMIVNGAASSEIVGKTEYLDMMIKAHSARLEVGYVYSEAGDGESTTDAVYAGQNRIAERGCMLKKSEPFSNTLILSEIDVNKLSYERRRMNTYPSFADEGYTQISFKMPMHETVLTRRIAQYPFIPESMEERKARCESILMMQAQGLKKRVQHTNCKSLVVGISGGLDSCLALLVAVRAMDLLGRDRKQIYSITMPCFGTTARTKGNAEILSEKLGVTLECIDITKSVLQHFEDIGQDPANHDVTFENAQARERTKILMDRANQTGGLVVGTGDLSELALGWATYNGDHMSMYGVNADIPKTLVRHLVQFEADRAEDPKLKEVLLDILATPVSPELLPAQDGEIAQKTEDIVGPYDLHDFYLYYIVRWAYSPLKIFRLACKAFEGVFDRETILKWMRTFYWRFFSQQFKRSCLADGPKVGSIGFSPRGDWKMPSDACVALWRKELENLK